MIVRFRVESEGNQQQDVIDEMLVSVSRIMRLLDQGEYGEWECTQDITVKSETGYKGRMVMKFHLNLEEDDETEG